MRLLAVLLFAGFTAASATAAPPAEPGETPGSCARHERGGGWGADCADSRRPHILLIVADDLGYGDLGSYGNTRFETPALDQLAREGMRFTQFYANGSICTPTRIALLTGQYPQRYGSRFATGFPSEQGLPGDVETLPRVLQRAGYRTHHVGKWHVGHTRPEFHPMSRGFDGFFGFLHQGELPNTFLRPFLRRDLGEPVQQVEHLTDALGREAVAFLRQPHDDPFFLQVWFFAPHAPVQPPPRWSLRFRNDYVALVSAMDENMGQILDALREQDLEDDTLVIFLSDNGGARSERNGGLRGVKWSNFEGGVRVPLLARWPGRIPADSRSDEIGATFDLFPTLAQIAGAKTGRHRVDGTSLAGVLLEGRPLRRRALFWETLSRFAFRLGDWKLVRSGSDNFVRDSEPVRLFNLAADPFETENLAEVYPGLRESLERRYQRMRRATHGIDPQESGLSGAALRLGDAVAFREPGGALSIAHDARLDLTDAEFTTSLWVRPAGVEPLPTRALVGQPGSWVLARSDDGRLLLLIAQKLGGFAGVSSSRVLEIGRWSHVAFTQTRMRLGTSRTLILKLYIDGVLDATATYHDTNPAAPSDSDLLLGNTRLGANPFVGVLAGLRFFNDDLTDAEIETLAAERPWRLMRAPRAPRVLYP